MNAWKWLLTVGVCAAATPACGPQIELGPNAAAGSGAGGANGDAGAANEPPLVCPAGHGDCDGNEANGCETDTTTSPDHCGACGHGCLGGACVAGACQAVTLWTEGGQPWRIAVDAANLYWSNTDGTIKKMPKEGGTPVTLVSGIVNLSGELRVSGDRLYWTGGAGEDAVSSVAVAGGPRTSVAGGTSTGSLAIDDAGVYWANAPTPPLSWPQGISILRSPSGGGPAVLLSPDALGVEDIEVDATDVYWSADSEAGSGSPGGLLRAPRGGGAATTLVAGDGVLYVALDTTHAYWATQGTAAKLWADGTILRVPKSGGAPELLAAGVDGMADLQVDATHVYWIETYGQKVRRVGKTGGDAVTLAGASDDGPNDLALDDVAAYWVNPDSGTLRRVAK